MSKWSVLLTRNPASTTLGVGEIDNQTGQTLKIYDIIMGSDTQPVDSSFLWRVQRHTGFGTGAVVTPQLLDLAYVSSTSNTYLSGLSSNPTLTANAFLLNVPLNQKQTFRWLAVNGSEMVLPSAGNGVTFLTPTCDGNSNARSTVFFETGGG